MLDPDQRQLYVNALKPPPGFSLGEAVATTYSLDLSKLLSLPFALAMPHLDPRRLGEQGAIELLQALRAVTGKLTVFCNRACIAAPYQNHVLYGMLESVVVEVAARGRGSLHAKLWLIRFDPTDHDAEPLMRLIVLSRNLTHDRCWDVSATFDGRITGRNRASNKPLVELLRLLPQRRVAPAVDGTLERVERLAEQAWRTDWELPTGFSDLHFHALGTSPKPKRWLPEQSSRLVVISPFVGAEALEALAATTRTPVALISRAEELDAVAPDIVKAFERVSVLDEAVETEDGEDTTAEAGRRAPRGLHAKAYIVERRWDTHVYLGSANATDGALLGGKNLELMVELVGKRRNGGIDGLLSNQGLGAMLLPYQSPAEPPVVDDAGREAERALSEAACVLAESGLSIAFASQGDGYLPAVSAPTPISLPRIAGMQAWLVTTDASSARNAMGLTTSGKVELAPCTPASVTGLVALELAADHPGVTTRFTLNIPITLMPADRDAHVTRLVVSNRERLLKYLMSLLDLDPGVLGDLEGTSKPGAAWNLGEALGAGLLERLVRARAREPMRLRDFQQVLDSLQATREGQALLPEELLQVWAAVKLPEAQP